MYEKEGGRRLKRDLKNYWSENKEMPRPSDSHER
jgi:hypothetical protein